MIGVLFINGIGGEAGDYFFFLVEENIGVFGILNWRFQIFFFVESESILSQIRNVVGTDLNVVKFVPAISVIANQRVIMPVVSSAHVHDNAFQIVDLPFLRVKGIFWNVQYLWEFAVIIYFYFRHVFIIELESFQNQNEVLRAVFNYAFLKDLAFLFALITGDCIFPVKILSLKKVF